MNEVLDMEWRFGVTAATDEVANCGSSYLQLRLVLDKGNGRTQTTDMGSSFIHLCDYYLLSNALFKLNLIEGKEIIYFNYLLQFLIIYK